MIERGVANTFRAGRDSAFPGDAMRQMEAADWASLSDPELLERRISKLGLRLDGTTVEPLIRRGSASSSPNTKSLTRRISPTLDFIVLSRIGPTLLVRSSPNEQTKRIPIL